MIGILSNYFFNWSYLLLAGYRLSSWQNCDDGVHNAYRMLHLPFHHLSTPSPHLLCSPSSFCSTFLPVSHSLHLPFSPSLSIDFSSAFPPGRRPAPTGRRPTSHVCLQPYAPCALRSAHLLIFSFSQLLSFPPSQFHETNELKLKNDLPKLKACNRFKTVSLAALWWEESDFRIWQNQDLFIIPIARPCR
jgi:hypothetical protein